MHNPDKDKRSAPSVILAYRRRQERAERLLMLFWLTLMALVLGAGYLVLRFLKPNPSAAALTASTTPALTGTAALPAADAALASTPEAPAAAAPAADALTPAVPETGGGLTPEAPPAESQPAEPSGGFTYTVQQGDTLAGIAAHFEVGLITVMSMNPQVTPEFLAVGDTLVLPATGAAPTAPSLPTSASVGELPIVEYTVAAGDTLAGIAQRYGVTVESIVFENGLESADQLSVGQKLRIRVETVTATPSVPSPGQGAGEAVATPPPAATP